MKLNINLQLREKVKKMFSDLENRSSIAIATGVTRQRISQLVKKLYTQEEIDEIDKLIKDRRNRKINLR